MGQPQQVLASGHRQAGVQRQVRTSRFEYAQQSDEPGGLSLHQHRHQLFRPDGILLAQQVGQLIGAALQVSIAQAGLRAVHRQRIGTLSRLLLDQRQPRPRRCGVFDPRSFAQGQQVLPLALPEQREVGPAAHRGLPPGVRATSASGAAAAGSSSPQRDPCYIPPRRHPCRTAHNRQGQIELGGGVFYGHQVHAQFRSRHSWTVTCVDAAICWTPNMTWKRGERLRSRSGWSISTRCSKGTS